MEKVEKVEFRQHPKRENIVVGSDGEIYRRLPTWAKNGYRSVNAQSLRGSGDRIRVHHLVLEAFYGDKPKGYVGHHKDRNTLNNSADNLIWVSKTAHVREHITKLTPENVDEVLRLNRLGLSASQIAVYAQIARHNVKSILQGKSWSEYTGIPKRYPLPKE